MLNLKKTLFSKKGFGIAEVLVSAAVLGFMVVALNKLQGGNHDTFLRIRGRDGAVEVAQEIMEKMKSQGAVTIPSKATADTTYTLDPVNREWERGLGGKVTVSYTPTITVSPTDAYMTKTESIYDTVQHVYAKQVNIKVSWLFKGSTQSINVSGVIR